MSQNIFGQVLIESPLQLGLCCILTRHSCHFRYSELTSADLCMQEGQVDTEITEMTLTEVFPFYLKCFCLIHACATGGRLLH